MFRSFGNCSLNMLFKRPEMNTSLSWNQLATLSQVQTPRYRREEQSPGIIHIGLGNFHRAHQALYLEDLFNQGKALDWGILGAGVRPGDARVRDALQSQDWLTTVVEVEPGARRARICGSMLDFLPVEPTNAALIQALANPRIRIVSLTITEGGYCINSATGTFDPDHPEIVADARNPQAPQGVFGTLLQGLRLRRESGVAPFTVLSCDNLTGNGKATRNAVVGLAQQVDPELARWVEDEVAFPDGMVDRITPVTTDREKALLQEQFGITDRWPVFCEPFRQWVLEDHFPLGRPELEEVGVTFTNQVAAFELMKLRILNGSHASIAYPGALLDLHFAHEAMEHPALRKFLQRMMQEEVIPIVPPVPQTDLSDYFRQIESRFSNPEIADTISRLAQDGSNRQPKFILPSTQDRIRQGLPMDGLALVSALWCRYLQGTSESGAPIDVDDVNGDRLVPAAHAASERPEAFLEVREVFGDLGQAPAFQKTFAKALARLSSAGVLQALDHYASGQ